MTNLSDKKLRVLYTCIYWMLLASFVSTEVITLQNDNINSILQRHEVVFVNFYADWCRFSQILTPIFLNAAEKIKKEFPQDGKVAFAKVDCDVEVDVAARYHISKYPTLKLFRNGEVTKREFRGQRQADAMAAYVREQLRDSIQEVTNIEQLDEIQDDNRRIIGYFATKDSDAYRLFSKMAGQLRDNCQFHAAFGAVSQNERSNGDNIVFRPAKSRRQDQVYMGDINNYAMMLQWATDKCVPVVREITFENAEELTEEGLPFLILFHKPDDTESVDLFSKEVSRQLITEKNSINCLTADGYKFNHPLHHLGKSTNDLPILAIDSFRHMYLFDRPLKDISQPGTLKQFVADLHSGKLHREFHHGPDPVTSSPPPPADVHIPESSLEDTQPDTDVANTQPDIGGTDTQPDNQPIPKTHETQPPVIRKTSPPISTFQKLKPSENRYTILRDEL